MTDDTPLPFDLPSVRRKKLTVDFAGGSGREDWSYLFTFKPTPAQDATAEPCKLIWDVPTEAKFLVLPFDFKNLPLP